MLQTFTTFISNSFLFHQSNLNSNSFRTPLGAVGLGGFYAQPHASASHQSHSDENKPGTSTMMHSSEAALPSGSGTSAGGKQKNRQGKSVRLNINARERRRMHDLNDVS
jgi:hypothetical protein